jgi:WXG100 family type VII secretion target
MAFKITPEILAQAATSCDNTNSEVQGQLTQLQQYVIQTEEWWQGIAQNAFANLMFDYDQYAAHLQAALTGIANVLRSNQANYTDIEQVNTNNINAIQQGNSANYPVAARQETTVDVRFAPPANLG